MIVDGKIGKLKGLMEHNDRRGLECYLEKHNKYSTLEAKEIVSQQKKTNLTINPKLLGNVQERRRWVKHYIYPWLPAKWLFRFIWMYGIRLGFLDGFTGFRFCLFISTPHTNGAADYKKLQTPTFSTFPNQKRGLHPPPNKIFLTSPQHRAKTFF